MPSELATASRSRNELYCELTAENGAPSLGTQNQVVEFILAAPELREAVAQWVMRPTRMRRRPSHSGACL